MSSSSEFLSSIRDVTRPLHKQLDTGGLSKEIGERNIKESTYKKHLTSLMGQNKAFVQRIQQFSQTSDWMEQLHLPKDFGLSVLAEDLSKISERESAVHEIKLKPPSHIDQCLAILYVWIGSSRGGSMIKKQIQRLNPELPTSYLETITTETDWTEFCAFLDAYEYELPFSEISAYGGAIFESIIEQSAG